MTAGGLEEDDKAMILAGASAVVNKSDVLQALYPAIVDAVKEVKSRSSTRPSQVHSVSNRSRLLP